MRDLGTFVLEDSWFKECYRVLEHSVGRHYLIADGPEDLADIEDSFHNHYIVETEAVYACGSEKCITEEPTLMRAELNTRYSKRYLENIKRHIELAGTDPDDKRMTVF